MFGVGSIANSGVYLAVQHEVRSDLFFCEGLITSNYQIQRKITSDRWASSGKMLRFALKLWPRSHGEEKGLTEKIGGR